MIVNGKDFRQMAAASQWILIKFLPFDDLDGVGINGYVYNYGRNIPLEPISVNMFEVCTEGGLYFTKIETAKFPIQWVQKYVYLVDVPDDAYVACYECNKFKSSELIIISQLDNHIYQPYCAKYPYLLQYLDVQPPDLCLMAIRKEPTLLRFIKRPTPEICMEAIKRNPKTILFIEEPTYEMYMLAIEKDPFLVAHLRNLPEEVNIAAVKKNWRVLQQIPIQTPRVCIEAILQSPQAIRHVQTRIRALMHPVKILQSD